MIRRLVVVSIRSCVLVILTAPAVVITRTLVVAVESGGSIGNVLDGVSFVADGSNGAERTVLAACLFLMVAAWLRISWVVAAIVVCRWRGHEPQGLDRRLTRMVLRLLALAPVVFDSVTPHVHAASTFEIMSVGGETHSSDGLDIGGLSVSRDALLVSMAVAVGVSWRLRHRRLAALRADVADQIDDSALAFESDVVRHGDDLALARLDLAVRSLVSCGNRDFRWLVQHATGVIHVECTRTSTNVPLWTRPADHVLALDAEVTLAELSRCSGPAQVRIPVLLPVGTTRAGAVWVNLESIGTFFVDGRDADADEVWSGLCQSLSLSPLHSAVHLVGASDNGLIGRRQLLADDPEAARRIAGLLDCSEEPSVLFVDNGSRRMLCAGDSSSARAGACGLVAKGGSWFLLPMEHPILPTRCGPNDQSTITTLIGAVEPIRSIGLLPAQSENQTEHHPVVRSILADTSFIARAMGRPSVDHVESGTVSFERSRSEELVLWLALHPERRQRSAARTEMWNVPVKDATFSNVTSDVRRSLTALEVPPEGEQWLQVTLTDDLPLHRRIITDVGILERCLDHARRDPDDGGPEVLMFGLGYVRGCPLEGSRYLWRDATGLTTQIAMLIVRASMLCAEMALERGDVEMLYASSAKGLAAVPGHEGLVALRMRQHADSDDRASLAVEWESYCRSLTSGDWGDSQPSPKMVDLWRSLSGRIG